MIRQMAIGAVHAGALQSSHHFMCQARAFANKSRITLITAQPCATCMYAVAMQYWRAVGASERERDEMSPQSREPTRGGSTLLRLSIVEGRDLYSLTFAWAHVPRDSAETGGI